MTLASQWVERMALRVGGGVASRAIQNGRCGSPRKSAESGGRTKPKRAVVYLRCSTGGQHAKNQRPAVELPIETRGFELLAVYEENVSAAARVRPEFERMMKEPHQARKALTMSPKDCRLAYPPLMAGPSRPGSFPRGVADFAARRAFVNDRAGGIVAIDIDRGVIVWKSSTSLRPVVATHGRLLAARMLPEPALQFVVLDATDGSDILVSTPIPLPSWAATLDSPRDVELDARTQGDVVTVRWKATKRYRGGAVPPRAAGKSQNSNVASGTVRLQLGTVPSPLGSADEPDAFREDGALDESSMREESDDPDVIEQVRGGDRYYQLVQHSSKGAGPPVTIRSVDSGSGERQWEVKLDDAAVRPPTALRK